jgi:hypothetical protein
VLSLLQRSMPDLPAAFAVFAAVKLKTLSPTTKAAHPLT